jgi:hypothetical protein
MWGKVTFALPPWLVILNSFQDNMGRWFVILKQVQDVERVRNSNDDCVILAIAVTQAVRHHLPAISKKQGWLLTIKEMSLL